MVIWFLKLVVLLGGKNLVRKALVRSSHVVIDPGTMNEATACFVVKGEREKAKMNCITKGSIDLQCVTNL